MVMNMFDEMRMLMMMRHKDKAKRESIIENIYFDDCLWKQKTINKC